MARYTVPKLRMLFNQHENICRDSFLPVLKLCAMSKYFKNLNFNKDVAKA